MVKKYEGMFLTHNQEARKDSDYLADHVKELIAKAGGTVVQMTRWDERKLAYPIKGVTHGIYFLVWFTGDSETEHRLRGEIKLSNLVLRHLCLRLDEFPDRPIESFAELQARLSGETREAASEGATAEGAPA